MIAVTEYFGSRNRSNIHLIVKLNIYANFGSLRLRNKNTHLLMDMDHLREIKLFIPEN